MKRGLLGNCLSDAGNVTKTNLKSRLKEIRNSPEDAEEYEIVRKYKDAYDAESKAKKKVKKAEIALNKKVNGHLETMLAPRVVGETCAS